ncbi:MAG TPA: hypothetical protein VFQ50_00090 [Flavobacterium sp.]|jgi:glucose dehydrogenase|nr:hypothetical protein [Flavobacterium sp.]
MENLNRTPQELEEIRQREIQEFADAAKRAEARAASENANASNDDTTNIDPSAEVSPSQQERYGQEHGNRRYSMFKNESSADDMPRTTDTTT